MRIKSTHKRVRAIGGLAWDVSETDKVRRRQCWLCGDPEEMYLCITYILAFLVLFVGVFFCKGALLLEYY